MANLGLGYGSEHCHWVRKSNSEAVTKGINKQWKFIYLKLISAVYEAFPQDASVITIVIYGERKCLSNLQN